MKHLPTGFDYSRLKYCGDNVYIAGSVVMKNPDLISIGDNVAIDDFCYISTALEVGSYVHIAPHCSIIGGRDALCVLKDYSGLAVGCRLICGTDDYLGSGLLNPMIPSKYRARLIYKPIVLEKHACLGTNCVIHPGVIVGEGAVVGSYSLVVKNLEPWHVYVGIPAKATKVRPSEIILQLEKQLREDLLNE
ncbi:acyltransferase [Chloroflexota bacterium]